MNAERNGTKADVERFGRLVAMGGVLLLSAACATAIGVTRVPRSAGSRGKVGKGG